MSLISDSYASFVNLDHRTDRLERMKASLQKVGIEAVRTRGMLPAEYVGDPAKVQVMRNRTPGAIGCHFSQVNVMRKALWKRSHAFVMEDDLVFCQDFHERMGIMEAFLQGRDWDVIWLGAMFHINPPWWHKTGLGRDAERTDHPRILRTYGAFSTHAYIVNRESIQKVLQMLDDIVSKSMGIDWAFIQMQPSLQTFAFVPGMVIQYDNKSDIGNGMTIYSNFKKLGPYWFQDRMEDFDPATFNWAEANR